MESFLFPGQGQLPDELVIFAPAALVAAIVLVLLAGRGDDPGSSVRARYFGAIGLLALFVALFAAYTTVQALADLLVDHQERAFATSQAIPPEIQSVLDSLGFSRFFQDFLGTRPYLTNPTNDGNYTAAMESGMIALAAGGLLAANLAVRKRAFAGDRATNSATARVDNVARFGAIFVASLSAAFAFATAGFAVYQIAAPGTAGALTEDVGRMEGVAALIAALALLVGSLVIVRGAVMRMRGGTPTSTTRKATASKTAATRAR